MALLKQNRRRQIGTWKASLKSCYKMINYLDYLELNGLNEMHDQKCTDLFPMEYSGHRWLENILIVDRIIKILPKLKVYSNEIKKDPDTKTCKTLKAAVDDVMLYIILKFCRAVSTTMEPFLKCFQSEKPNAFFVYEKIGGSMFIVMERFVRSEVLSASSSPIKLLV